MPRAQVESFREKLEVACAAHLANRARSGGRDRRAEVVRASGGVGFDAVLPEPCELGLPVVSDHDPRSAEPIGTQAGLRCDGHALLVKVIETEAA